MNFGDATKICHFIVGIASLLSLTPAALAKKSSENIYTEPFDLAAGGTTLTRASQEGIVFANPALLPLGGAWVRWFGLQTGFMLDKDLAAKVKSGKLSEATGAEDNNFVASLFEKSLHFGQTATLGFLNKNFAITVFDRIEVDFEGEKYGDGGMPAININAEAYAGALASVATQPWRWLSLGITGKYLYKSEPDFFVPVSDQDRLQELASDPSSIQSELAFGRGTGTDIGALLFWQNMHVDLSLGLKIEDLGDTKFTEDQASLPQTYNAGLALAFHTSKDVLHLSLDYRDISNAYEERTFKKIYAGARLLLRQRIGIAVGLYQGIPSYGVRLDLLLVKVGFTAYGRELGQYPGDKQRNLYMVYTSIGY